MKHVIAGCLTPLCPVLGLPRNRGSTKQHFALRSSSRHDFVLCYNTLMLRLASLTIPFSFLGQQNQTFFAGLPHFTYRSFYFFIFTLCGVILHWEMSVSLPWEVSDSLHWEVYFTALGNVCFTALGYCLIHCTGKCVSLHWEVSDSLHWEVSVSMHWEEISLSLTARSKER